MLSLLLPPLRMVVVVLMLLLLCQQGQWEEMGRGPLGQHQLGRQRVVQW
jgi:hypothetical protein